MRKDDICDRNLDSSENSCSAPYDRQISPWNLLGSATGFVAIVLNVLILRVVYKNPRHFITITNSFVVNLALANLCTGLFLPLQVLLSSTSLLKRRASCLAFQEMKLLPVHVSDLTLTFIALERFIAISCPFHYQRYVSLEKVALLLLATWGCAAALSVPAFLSPAQRDVYCHCWTPSLALTDPHRMLANSLLTVIPTFLILLLCNVYIYKVAVNAKAADRRFDSSEKTPGASVSQQMKRVRILLYLPVVYAVCNVPECLMFLLMYSRVEYNLQMQTHILHVLCALCIAVKNVEAVCNPVLYAYLNTDIGLAARQILFGSCLPHFTDDPKLMEHRHRLSLPHPTLSKHLGGGGESTRFTSSWSNSTFQASDVDENVGAGIDTGGKTADFDSTPTSIRSLPATSRAAADEFVSVPAEQNTGPAGTTCSTSTPIVLTTDKVFRQGLSSPATSDSVFAKHEMGEIIRTRSDTLLCHQQDKPTVTRSLISLSIIHEKDWKIN